MKIEKGKLRLALLTVSVLLLGACAQPVADTPEELARKDKLKTVTERLFPKAAEYANLSYPLQEQRDPSVKLKIALVSNLYGEKADFAIKGFMANGNTDEKAKIFGLNVGQLAESPEEVKTVIRVKCDKGKAVGTVKKTKPVSLELNYYASVCEVSVFDLDSQKMIAQKKFENPKPVDSALDLAKFGSDSLTPPAKELEEFLKSLKFVK